MKNWQNDRFVDGTTGIKDIPWGSIDQTMIAQMQKYGIMDVLVTLPDGKQIVNSLNGIAIKP